MSIRKTLTAAAVAGLLAAATAPAQAGALLGAASLNAADDLTRISYGSVGGVYEFLDLTLTLNNTVGGALATYGAQNFRLANSSELAELFLAFGFSYVQPAAGGSIFTPVVVTPTQAENFSSFLGITFDLDLDPLTLTDSASLGFYQDLNVIGLSYACVSLGACESSGTPPEAAFTRNADPSPHENIGVFLVRDATDVPEPATLLLTSLGLLGLGALRRRKQTA